MSAQETLPPVARKIYSPCKKCGVDRYHIVIAHTSAKVAKLQCEVCNAKSTYKVGGTSKRGGKKKEGTSRSSSSQKRWTELKDKNTNSKQSYSMKNSYNAEAAIEHPKFGLGFVVSSTPQAIQVVFEDGERSLVHNRGE